MTDIPETIKVEDYRFAYLLKEVPRKILELAYRPEGVMMTELAVRGQTKAVSVSARSLLDANLVCRMEVSNKVYRYFGTQALKADYMRRHNVREWEPINGRCEPGAHAATANKTMVFAKDAAVDMSKAKIFKNPTPDNHRFNTVYDPNEKARSHRYYNNLSKPDSQP